MKPPIWVCNSCPLGECDFNGSACGIVCRQGKWRRRVNEYGARGNGPAERDRSDYFKEYFSDPDNRARNTEAQRRHRQK